jgi:hypothetical protein
MAVEIKEKDGNTLYKSGNMMGYKTSYDGEINYTIGNKWDTKSAEEDDMGLCYDFKEENYQDLINVLLKMKDSKADVYKPDPEYAAFEKKREAEEKTLWWKIKDKLKDIGISATPFDWKLHGLFLSRPVGSGRGSKKELVYKLCHGFCFGPITITW